VLPWENLRARDNRRARRRTDRTALERLEERQLLSYSSLGYSLADLRISGSAGTVASWGSTLQVSAIVQNIGASTMTEPLSQTPPGQIVVGADGNPVPPFAIPSTASAPDSVINVFLTHRPRSLAGAIQIGSFTATALEQNSVEQLTTSIVLPQRPSGFAKSGIAYIRLQIVPATGVAISNDSQTLSAAIPVRFITQALPELRTTALDVPSVMQPGDTIVPTFQITNLGTASTNPQRPVQVALVASVSPDFNLGSSIVALYTLPSPIPGASDTPVTVGSARHHGRLSGLNGTVNNVTPGNNVETFTGTPVTLPTSPNTYFLGIVIDPNNLLNQLSLPSNRLEQIQVVGPPIPGLPPAGVVGSAATQQFPNPPDGVPIGLVNPAGV
jgi:hypothetical protein